jgi:hypothetical protein
MKKFMPHIGLTLVVVFLVLAGLIMFISRTNSSTSETPNSQQSSASDAETLAAKAQVEDDPSSASSSASAVPQPPAIKEYLYPGSQIKVSTAVKLELESSDPAEKITEWYKTKIARLNFNAKSFSQTSTNGAIFNKLSAAKPGEKIEITIKKDQTTSKTMITVDRS